MINHVKMFWFREDADPEVAASVMDGIADFIEIPTVMGVAISPNRGNPERSAPFTHGAILTFEDIAGRDAFFAHERHIDVRERAMRVFGELVTLSIES